MTTFRLEEGDRITLQTAVGPVQLRRKGDWHWAHFWLPIGVWFLDLVWSGFERETFMSDYHTAAQLPRAIYVETEHGTITRDQVLHEVRHFIQALRHFAWSLRYGFRLFRLRQECEAYVVHNQGMDRDDIIEQFAEGEYGPIPAEVVEREVDRAFRLYGWERPDQTGD